MTRACRVAPEEPPTPAGHPGDSFLDAFRADWQAFGAEAIVRLRTEKPADYVRIAASLFAKEQDRRSDPLHELTDAELLERIDAIAAAIGLEIRPRGSPRGAGEADRGGAPER